MMMRIGIVGHEAAKFTEVTEYAARQMIRFLLEPEGTVLVSGGCHLGGIDIWAEEVAEELGREKIIHYPQNRCWEPRGYKARNMLIAQDSDEVANIVVAQYPGGYTGRRFTECYHCKARPHAVPHIKSGGCWTAIRARHLGKQALWYVVQADGKVVGDAA